MCYRVIIPIPANTYINQVYIICMRVRRIQFETLVILIFKVYTLIHIRPANRPKVCDTYLCVGTQQDTTRKFSQTTAKARVVYPYQIREKRRGIMIIKTIHDSAGNTENRCSGIFVSTYSDSLTRMARFDLLRHRASEQHAVLGVGRTGKTMIKYERR